MNTFDVLNNLYREDVISDFLKNCFEDSRTFLNQFLAAANIELDNKLNYNVSTRLGLGKPIGTPDMIIYETGVKIPKITVIEKNWARAKVYSRNYDMNQRSHKNGY